MTAVPSDQALSRFYDTPHRSFRFTRKTAFALSVAVGFHALVGYYAAKGHFEPILPPYEEDEVVKLTHYLLVPPPPPPIVKDIPRAPPVLKPATVAIREVPIFREMPFDPIPAEPTDANPFDGPAVSLHPDPEPVVPTPSIPKPDPIIRNPSWLKKPTAQQIGNLYPERAATREIGGGATLLCQVAENGDVNSCAVVDESPKGYGFGAAALSMARYFRMNPRTVDGAIQSGSKVRIPIVFNLG